jgi:hypothetical protein
MPLSYAERSNFTPFSIGVVADRVCIPKLWTIAPHRDTGHRVAVTGYNRLSAISLYATTASEPAADVTAPLPRQCPSLLPYSMGTPQRDPHPRSLERRAT